MMMSHSARERFATCHRLHYLHDVKRLEPLERPTGRKMGAWFARALEHGDPLSHYEDVRRVLQHGDPEVERQVLIEARQVECLARAYMQRNPDHGIVRELEFRDDVVGHGFLDGFIEETRSGVEEKLLLKFFWNRAAELHLALRPQITAYFYAMRERGTPINVMKFRPTFKPSITQNSRTGETLDQYGERLAADIERRPEMYFAEYECRRSDAELEEFRLEALELERQRKQVARAGVYPKTGAYNGGCTAFGGCAMLPICRQEPNASTLYRVRAERPILTQFQQSVLDILDTSFTGSATTVDLARQLGCDARPVGRAASALVKVGLVSERIEGRLRVISRP